MCARIYDDNNDGVLDEEEFCSAMRAAGYSKAESKQMFDDIDVDKNGQVSMNEYLQWFVDVDSNTIEDKPLGVDDVSSADPLVS